MDLFNNVTNSFLGKHLHSSVDSYMVLCNAIKEGDLHKLNCVLHDPTLNINILDHRFLAVTTSLGSKQTPLHLAVETGNLSIIEALLSEGANPDLYNEQILSAECTLMDTPLHQAIKLNQANVVKLLLDYQANATCSSKMIRRGESNTSTTYNCFRVAIEYKADYEILERLYSKHPMAMEAILQSPGGIIEEPPLFTAIACNHLHGTRFLVEKDALKQWTVEGVNPYSLATLHRSTEVLEYLLDQKIIPLDFQETYSSFADYLCRLDSDEWLVNSSDEEDSSSESEEEEFSQVQGVNKPNILSHCFSSHFLRKDNYEEFVCFRKLIDEGVPFSAAFENDVFFYDMRNRIIAFLDEEPISFDYTTLINLETLGSFSPSLTKYRLNRGFLLSGRDKNGQTLLDAVTDAMDFRKGLNSLAMILAVNGAESTHSNTEN